MARLDSLSLQELKKLYVRSAWLYQPGLLGMIFTILSGICGIIPMAFAFVETSASTGIFIFALASMILAILVFFANAYVFMYVRTPVARTFFYMWAISNLALSTLAIVVQVSMWTISNLAHGYLNIVVYGVNGLVVLGAAILLLISAEVLKSARTDAIFGTDVFSHEQIALAKKKMFRNEHFVDEDLPKFVSRPVLSKICIIVAFVWEILVILGMLDQIFECWFFIGML